MNMQLDTERRQNQQVSPAFNRRLGRAGGLGVRRVNCLPRFTVIVKDVDLGLNNELFIRGQGAGLSWDIGQKLARVDRRTWVWSAVGASTKLEFQLLLDDEVWEKGSPRLLKSGQTVLANPDFEWPDIPRVSTRQPNLVCH